MSSYEIAKRQNEDTSLKIQYAARCYFNSAETYNNLTWLCCFVSLFSIFLPSTFSQNIKSVIPFVFDILAAFFCYIANRKVNKGAKLRKYFDSYVIGIYNKEYAESEIRNLKEYAERNFLKKRSVASVQVAHTGNDVPPGVRDWYVFPKEMDGFKAKFECQRQNTWWNSKLARVRLLVSALFFAAIVLFLICKGFGVIVYSAGLIIKISERFVENYRYNHISRLIEGSQITVESTVTEDGIKTLQSLIDERRAINVLEISLLHKKVANYLTSLYERITS